MEPRRGFGMVAIAIGLVLLGFMMGRSGDSRWGGHGPGYGYQQMGPQQGYQQAPQQDYQQAPQQGFRQMGPGQGYGPMHGRGGQGGHGGFFFLPLMLIGGLMKLGLLALLALALLKFFGKRPWGGPPWQRRDEPKREEREPKDPEEPTSYTGGTTRL